MTASSRSRRSCSEPVFETLGDQALVIVFGTEVDARINERVCAAAASIAASRLPGVQDVVPSFAAVTVHYRAADVPAETTRGELPSVFIRKQIEALLREPETRRLAEHESNIIDIPVCYGGEYGPDLDEVAAVCGLKSSEVIDLHQQALPLRVYMLGFAPGAPYIGLLDERLAIARRATPRVNVPAGSVGLANRQSVIYPVAAPGGWSLIGRTPSSIFDPSLESPALLGPGSLVRFKAIDEHTFVHWTTR